MINRDDWLSPAAFVARIDLEAKPVDDPEHARKLSKLKDRFLENLEEIRKILERKIAEGIFAGAVDCQFVKVCGPQNLLLADAPADAKIGTQLRIRLPKDYCVTDGPGCEPPQEVTRRFGARVCASHQTGCMLVVERLVEPLDVGTVFTIDGVIEWREPNEREVGARLREFIITAPAEVGHTVIMFYPPIAHIDSMQRRRTVVGLPINGACIRKVIPAALFMTPHPGDYISHDYCYIESPAGPRQSKET
jgi:hypothetical protein